MTRYKFFNSNKKVQIATIWTRLLKLFLSYNSLIFKSPIYIYIWPSNKSNFLQVLNPTGKWTPGLPQDTFRALVEGGFYDSHTPIYPPPKWFNYPFIFWFWFFFPFFFGRYMWGFFIFIFLRWTNFHNYWSLPLQIVFL